MRQHAARTLRWLGSLALLYVALHPKSPYLIALRAFETPLLIAAGAAGMGLFALRRANQRCGNRERGLLAALLLTVIILACGNEITFRRQRNEVLAADGGMRQLGQHFIVGYTSFAEVAMLAERGLIGGIYLGRGNVRGRTLAAIRSEIDALQELRQRAGLPALLIAADQEGGAVAHMTPPLMQRPSLATLVAGGTDATLEIRAHTYGEAQGRELAALGINLNLGPVADLNPMNGGSLFDTHTRIAQRAIAADPALVTRITRSYGAALLAQGVRPTLKHFPGLGQVTTDTHHFPASLSTPVERLVRSDWKPFRVAAQSGAAIMLAHVVLPEIDPILPASLSLAVVQGVLRRSLNHQGLLLTDDLNMGAVFRLGIDHAAIAALNAGVDMLLISYDPDQYYRAMHGAAHALRQGNLDLGQLARSRRRIATAGPAAGAPGLATGPATPAPHGRPDDGTPRRPLAHMLAPSIAG